MKFNVNGYGRAGCPSPRERAPSGLMPHGARGGRVGGSKSERERVSPSQAWKRCGRCRGNVRVACSSVSRALKSTDHAVPSDKLRELSRGRRARCRVREDAAKEWCGAQKENKITLADWPASTEQVKPISLRIASITPPGDSALEGEVRRLEVQR